MPAVMIILFIFFKNNNTVLIHIRKKLNMDDTCVEEQRYRHLFRADGEVNWYGPFRRHFNNIY
jgi:hypothetical protein